MTALVLLTLLQSDTVVIPPDPEVPVFPPVPPVIPSTFTMTARDMVTQAMREIGVIASGENPTADELSDGIFRLNSMLKAYAAKGVNLWRDTEGEVAFPAGRSTQVVGGALSITDVRVINPDGRTDRPLGEWQTGDYRRYPAKMQRGEPVAYVVANSVAALSLTLWPVPARDLKVRYSYARVTGDVVQPSDPIDVPQMFLETIWLMLALRLAPTFGKARADPQTVQMVAARAAELERDMLDWDRPDSYYLGPDRDGYW